MTEPRMHRPVVLLAAAEPILTDCWSLALEWWGYKCVATDTGKHLTALLSASRPEVLVIDANLLDMSGREALWRLRAAGVTVPAVVTTHSHIEANDQWAALGAVVLHTPFGVPDLLLSLVRAKAVPATHGIR